MPVPLRKLTFSALILSLLATSVAARDAVDRLARRWIATNHIPGVSIAVLRRGKPVLSRGYGVADLEWSAAATPNTVYELGSVTKQFTAAAILTLVEAKALSLDQQVAEILPGLPEAWRGMTIRHLLNHTAGIKNYSNAEIARNPRKDYTKQELLALITAPPLEFKPGDRWSYTNSGYFVLGLVVEKVSGQDYGAYLERRVFKPLGMHATRINDRRVIFADRAEGYDWVEDHLEHGEYMSPSQPFAAGALVSSIADLAKWDAALYTDKLLPAALLEQMWMPARLNDGSTANYGFGWNVGTYRTRKRVAHDGVIQGFSSYIARFVEDGLTVMVLMNKERGPAELLANAIAELYLPVLRDNAPRPIDDHDPALSQSLRGVIRTVATGSAEPQWFTAEGQKCFFPDRIKDGAKILGAHGELQTFDLMEEAIDNGKPVRGYKAVFGTIPLRVELTLDTAGKIEAIRVEAEQ